MRKVYLMVLFILFMLAPAVKALDTGTATVINSTLIIPIGEFSTSFTYAPVHVWQSETTITKDSTTIIEKIYPSFVSIYTVVLSGATAKELGITYSNGGTNIHLWVGRPDSGHWFGTDYTYTLTVSGTMISIRAEYLYGNPFDISRVLKVKELYYNNYGTSIFVYSYSSSSTSYVQTGNIFALFYKVFSFTNFSLTGNIDNDPLSPFFIMTYTINGTYYAETHHPQDPHKEPEVYIFTIGTNTATVYFTVTTSAITTLPHAPIFTILLSVKYDDFFIAGSESIRFDNFSIVTSWLNYTISYGTHGGITITGNSVIYGTYTLIFSTTATGHWQTQINMIILTKGTSGVKTGFGMYPVILQLPSFQINNYSVSGSIIYVDGTLYYPGTTDGITTVYPDIYDVQNHTWYPLGTRINYAITYIDLSNTAPPASSNRNIITNTSTQEFISTYSTIGSTAIRNETYLTYFSVKIPLEVDTIISSGQSITISDTHVLGPIMLSFSNGSPLFSLTDVPTIIYTWTTVGYITTSTTQIFPTTETIYIYDTLTTLPPYITYYSTPGTYTITKIYPVTFIWYAGGSLIYAVYTVEVIYRAEINYTPTGTSTSTAAANSAPFSLTLSSVNDTEITGTIARIIISLLWLIEAALFIALLYSAYRYATASTEEERRKYLYRTLYVLASMLTIYVLPRALDWIAGL